MKLVTKLLVFAVCLTSAVVCRGQRWENVIPARNISGLQLVGPMEVHVEAGTEERLLVKVDGYDEDEIRAERRESDSTLVFFIKNGRGLEGLLLRGKASVKVHLTVKQLSRITATDGVLITSDKKLVVKDLDITNSNSEINLLLDARAVRVRASGKAETVLAGTAHRLSIWGSGKTAFYTNHFRSNTCNAMLADRATAEVYASEQINATAADNSFLRYYGPAVAEKTERNGATILYAGK